MRDSKGCFWWLLTAISLQASMVVVRAPKPPNIIFFLADDLGWADTSFRGNPQIPTPNLDVLAASGIILNNYYIQYLCSPSRGALLTGLYPIHTGLQHNMVYQAEPWGLSPNFTIMPEYLKELGYASHIIGKWGIGYYKESYTPTYRGFDSFYGYYNGGEDYYSHKFSMVVDNDTELGLDFWNDTTPVRDQGGHYSTRLFTERALSLIKDHDVNKPLFLFMAHQAVHCGDCLVGMKAPASSAAHFPYIHDSNRSIHAGAVYELDQSVGMVMESLHRRGMLENSVVVFSSDNGARPLGPGANAGSNWPLRGGKSTLWEGGVRGAAFVWSPLLSRVGRLSDQMMHISDWLPTFYTAAGGNLSRLGDIDGKDMWDALSKNLASPRHEILLNIDPIYNYSALIFENRKVILGDTAGGLYSLRTPVPGGTRPVDGLDQMMLNSRTAAVLKDFYKVQQVPVRPNWRQEVAVNCSYYNPRNNFADNVSLYYFDVKQDPCELDNLAPTNVTGLEELMKKLKAYEATMLPPANEGFDPKGFPKNNQGLWAPWQ
ncbi:arylsulfatase B-like [Ixodes scapularis]|uniref:arylsulfatase B-like n=1 Tax=Ixodes scapularis TaxID=6945 RepID=UPI001A9F74D0|nr:arylsulfatase B-like [Ixodes scapularis]